MATIGIMTAIAILPPELKPPEPPEPDPEALKAEGVGDAREEVETLVAVFVKVLEFVGSWVDVTTTTDGVVGTTVETSAEDGVRVVVAVTLMTLGVVEVGSTTVVDGGSEVIEVMVVGAVVGVVVGSLGTDVVVSVMVIVVVGEVVKLMEVVVMVVMLTEALVVATAVSEVVSGSC